MAEEKKALIARDMIVMPAVSPEKAVEAFEAYQALAKKIMTKDDVQIIVGREFKKKSFWRKCQRFFNLSIEIIKEEREVYDNHFTYKFVVRATAPNGAFMDGAGSCSSDEKGLLKTEHNTRAIAETRAKNRAISDLVAFGEVSAEEVDGNPEHSDAPQQNNGNGEKHYDFVSEKQAKRFYALCKGGKRADPDVKKYLQDIHGVDSAMKLKPEAYDMACDWAQGK